MCDMKTLLRVLAVTAIFLVSGGAVVSASEPIGKVLNATTTLRASGNAGTRILNDDANIFFLDRISSNTTGSGEFEFSDGTKLAVGPSASLVVDQFIFKDKSSLEKLGLNAAKGTFRWISGHSPSSAYQIKTPLGTMGIRGTAFDVTIRNGHVYVALITGSARFCSGSTCRTLNQSCDYIDANGGKISKPTAVSAGFTKPGAAAQVFPFLANPDQLSQRFHVGGGNCLGNGARTRKSKDEDNDSDIKRSTTPDRCGGNCGGDDGGEDGGDGETPE